MENINLIRKIAWTFTRNTGMDYDDLFSEASLAYYEGLRQFDKNKGNAKLTTYLTKVIRNRMIDYCNHELLLKKKNICVDNVIIPNYCEIRIKEKYENLFTEKHSEIISIILNNPEYYADMAPKFARGELVRKLRENGYAFNKIWTEIRKLKNVVNEMELDSIII